MRLCLALGAVTIAIFALMAAAFASERQLHAHQHGHGTLNVAIEGQSLWIELEAPGFDIVGFEHRATTPEDKAKVEAAENQLARPQELFGLPPEAACTLDGAAVTLSGLTSEESDEHEEDHQEDAHEHEDHESESHSVFHAEYGFTCQRLEEVTRIALTYFDRFPRAESLEVNLINEQSQGRMEVGRATPVLDLTRF